MKLTISIEQVTCQEKGKENVTLRRGIKLEENWKMMDEGGGLDRNWDK